MKITVDKGIKSFEKIITSINGFNEIEFEYLETQEITNDKLQDTEALFIRSTTSVDNALLKNTKIKIVGSATAVADPTILILVFLSKALSTEVVDLINNASVSCNLSLVISCVSRYSNSISLNPLIDVIIFSKDFIPLSTVIFIN